MPALQVDPVCFGNSAFFWPLAQTSACASGDIYDTVGAIAIGDYTEAATVVVLFGVADSLEANCVGKARNAIAAVMELKPETALLADSGEWWRLQAPSSV